MLELRAPNGAMMQFRQGSSGIDVAKTISQSLEKTAFCIKINGKIQDIYLPIEENGDFEIITEKSKEYQELIRHDAAHVLAQAAKELFPSLQVVIGPAIENGFYYDFAKDEPFTPEDLKALEEKMKEVAARKTPIKREIWKREDAIEFFKSIGESYKAEIIKDIPEGEQISMYKQGDFIDLCRGPHAPHTGFVKHFKLLKVFNESPNG
jgi:threonyl-tRNA synthetase